MAQTKMTQAQKRALVEELEKPENRFLLNSSSHPPNPDSLKRKWNEIAGVVNSWNGPRKTGDKWRKSFVELRCHVNKKARGVLMQKQCGMDPTSELTDLEIRLYNLCANRNGTEEIEIEPSTNQEESSEETEEEAVDIPAPPQGSSVDPIKLPSSSNPAKDPSTFRRPGVSWRDPRKVKSVRSVMRNEQTRLALETFASAAQMQADALQQVATSIQRIAHVQEQSSLRLVNILERFIHSMENGMHK